MWGVRPEVVLLEQNDITAVAFSRIGGPSVIPLWFGEGNETTPAYIREAAKTALDDGETFYVPTGLGHGSEGSTGSVEFLS